MDELIEEANERLKAAGVAVRVHKKGDYLYLRAVLPPKQGSQKGQPHWQFVAATGFAPWVRANKVGIRRVEREAHSVYLAPWVCVNRAGVQRAQAEARRLHNSLVTNTFDWTRYLRAQKESEPQFATKPVLTSLE